MANICRKVARGVADRLPDGHAPSADGAAGGSPQTAPAPAQPVVIAAGALSRYLGPRRFTSGVAEEQDQLGVATGLTWSPVGGDVTPVEVSLLEGKGNLILTGQLGEVMRELAQAALSYTRSRARALHLPEQFHDQTDVHIHVPAGGAAEGRTVGRHHHRHRPRLRGDPPSGAQGRGHDR